MDFLKTGGLIPAIIQDAGTGKVLMLGYMNEEALEKTKADKRVTFYSRSKKRLWTKGEESGNFLELVSLTEDCDQDTLLIKVRPQGPVCHTGTDTCFREVNTSPDFLLQLEAVIASRRSGTDSTSYTASLFSKGINKIAQKVGEEATELVIEAKDNNDALFLNEAADLLFHYLILLQAKGKRLDDVIQVLKVRQKK
ncbi:MAG: bifunctional phosphoribosyl-AMP cyclohydrolase/phosphoribosyl-ATP diphosphatase HisIE [Bacteroidia bacterium]|nr:bifunctional phosphoribosyl-AMP cyclohydrolase/phosphoribosyl-ATP diphosphatase HisIE [Bacteroidia bacterium]